MVVFNLRLLFGFNGLAALIVTIFAIWGAVEAQESPWTEMYIPYNNLDETGNTIIDAGEFTDNYPYTAEDPLRQHLHVFQNPSDKPSPVYLFAHENGGTAENNIPLSVFAEAGYSVISWESVTNLSSEAVTIETCMADFELVWSWFQSNAEFYNFDPESVVVGGRSRGSICSWPMAHSQKPGIRGIYMYNALPNGAWKSFESDGVVFWEELITINSPPAVLTFGPECPKPITQDCEPSPDPSDGHNPKNGQKIVNKYTELGIESRISLIDGLKNKGMGPFDLFPNFAAALSRSSTESPIGLPTTGPTSVPISSPTATTPAVPIDTQSRALPRFHLPAAVQMFACHLLLYNILQNSF